MLPIVPLVGEAGREVPSPAPVDVARVDLDELDKRLRQRLEAVGKKLIDTELGPVTNAVHRWALRMGWQWLVAGRVTARIMAEIRSGLAQLG